MTGGTDTWSVARATQKPRRKPIRFDSTFLMGLIFLLAAHLMILSISGHSIWETSSYNTYALQAWAWRRGEIALAQDYPWLELAPLHGKYYVSFPPVPALLFYPLTFLFPQGYTPDYLMVTLYSLGSYAALYAFARRMGASPRVSLFWAFFAVLGGGLIVITTSGGLGGGVWFQAQGLSFLLSSAALLCAVGKGFAGRILSALCLALAVGCRPFQIAFFPFLFVIFLLRDGEGKRPMPMKRRLLRLLPVCILPALVGMGYMAYNHVRFGNVFEFGHNYLPEFQRAAMGQFHIRYLWPNIRTFFFGLPHFTEKAALESFFGFSMFLANPLYAVAVCMGIYALCLRRARLPQVVFTLCAAVWLFLTLLHKSFGGFQFGARYTVDALPFLLGAVLLFRDRDKLAPNQPICWAAGLAMMWNAYGAIVFSLRV